MFCGFLPDFKTRRGLLLSNHASHAHLQILFYRFSLWPWGHFLRLIYLDIYVISIMWQALYWVLETQCWMVLLSGCLMSVKWLPPLTPYRHSVNDTYVSYHHLEEQTFRFGFKLNAAKHASSGKNADTVTFYQCQGGRGVFKKTKLFVSVSMIRKVI